MGGANVWSVMSADPDRDLVFLPTTPPSPDFYGGRRPGDNAFANSVVALRASKPLLFEHVSADGTKRPAVARASKTGFVFVLDRETGAPLHPVEERTVPRSDVPGEEAARTQPFPTLRLHATDARPLAFWDFHPEHRAACARLADGIRASRTSPSAGGPRS